MIFSPNNQDKGCLILIKYYCNALNSIKNGNIKDAIKKCNNTWTSLPDSKYKQRTETMEDFIKHYNRHLSEELQNISNLSIDNE